MMFVVLRRRLLFNPVLDSNTQFHASSFKALFCSTCSDSEVSDIASNVTAKPSFTVSYLINSCGLSPKAAVLASKRINFETPENPDSVIALLKRNGFNSTQISDLVRKRPYLLNYSISKTLVPKIEFLRSTVGISSGDLPILITKMKDLLFMSLEQSIIPSYEILKSVLHSDVKVVKVFLRLTPKQLYGIRKNVALNMSILKELGVEDRCITSLLLQKPQVLCSEVDKFNEAVKKIAGMGFDPAKSSFTRALTLCFKLSRETWDAKLDNFLSWGFSKEQLLSALRKYPTIFELSEKIINDKMDILVNEMGFQADGVLRAPVILGYDLEKRIVPRCAAIRILFLKGLIKKEPALHTFLAISNKDFLNKYLKDHLEEVPQLLDLIQGKVDPRELGFKFSGKREA